MVKMQRVIQFHFRKICPRCFAEFTFDKQDTKKNLLFSDTVKCPLCNKRLTVFAKDIELDAIEEEEEEKRPVIGF